MTIAGLGILDLLKVRRDILREMIEMTEKWEENCNRLRLQMMKDEEQYKARIESYNNR